MKCIRCKQNKDQLEFAGTMRCAKCREYWYNYYKNNLQACKDRAKYHRNKDRARTNEVKRKLNRKNPVNYMLGQIRRRAKLESIQFDLTHADIKIPERCPILDIALRIGDGKATGCSPSLDRIIPELGYVKGNVHVISLKANTIKSNATPDEIGKVADYMRKMVCQSGNFVMRREHLANFALLYGMYKFEYYKDNAGEWRWRIVHQNGNIIAISSEGYKNKQDMLEVFQNLAEALKTEQFQEIQL